jgi:tetratricopeptide (TPR) repeat protein
MIVRNESPVIERCLASVAPLIDCWCLVDTGSDDDTVSKVKAFFARLDLPGQMHHREWIDDFGASREQALELSKPLADYSLFIDADEVLVQANGEPLTAKHGQTLRQNLVELGCELGLYKVKFDDTEFPRYFVCRNDVPFHWRDPLHEVLKCERPCRTVLFTWLVNKPRADGARSRSGDKFKRDIAVLRRHIAVHGAQARWLFYLAQSLQCDGQLEAAAEVYKQRLELGEPSTAQDLYVTYQRLGDILYSQGHKAEALLQYALAYDLDPERAEAPLAACKVLRARGANRAALLWAHKAVAARHCSRDGKLFVQASSYGWESTLEAARCIYADHRAEPAALQQCMVWMRELLQDSSVPPNVRQATVAGLAKLQQQWL